MTLLLSFQLLELRYFKGRKLKLLMVLRVLKKLYTQYKVKVENKLTEH